MRPILLVEDDAVLARGVATVLELDGFPVKIADRGRTVVGLVASYDPIAVVIDMKLPDIDGLVAAGAVRASWPNLPIILITGRDVTDATIAATAAELNVIMLQKPFAIDELKHLLSLPARR